MAVWRVSLAALLLLGSPGLLQGQPEVEEETVRAVHVQQLGGWFELPAQGSDAQRMAEFAESELSSTEAGQCRYRTRDIQQADMQVINGINYRLKLEMEKTGCQEEEVVFCDILIFEDKQGTTKTIQEKNCTPANK